MNLSSVCRGDGLGCIHADSGVNEIFCLRTAVLAVVESLRQADWTRKLARLVAIGIGVLHAACGARAGEPTVTESQIKAAFLLNFAKYVEWPPASFSDSSAPLIMGVLGDEELSRDIERMSESKTICNRRFEFRRIATVEDAANCHVVFIGTDDPRQIAEFLDRLRDTAVLTVGQSDDFLDRGGVINLARRERKIRVDINLAAARQARLKISSKLITIADQIRGR